MPNDYTKPLSAADIPVFWVATTTRSTNAFSGSLPTTPTLATGLVIRWQVPSAPSGAATYNLNGLGAKNIFARGSANTAADLPANRIVTMIYDGTQWQMIACNTLVPGDMPAKRKFKAYLTAGQTATGTYKLLFDSAIVNDGHLTVSSSTFTATRDMVVQLDLSIFSTANGSIYLTGLIYKNGAVYKCGESSQATYVCSLSRSVDLSSGDTIEIYVSAGGSCALSTANVELKLLSITEL